MWSNKKRARLDWAREREGRLARQARWYKPRETEWELTLRVFVQGNLGYWSNAVQLEGYRRLFASAGD